MRSRKGARSAEVDAGAGAGWSAGGRSVLVRLALPRVGGWSGASKDALPRNTIRR